VGEVRKRLGNGNVEPLIVVDADRVVLGLVTSELLNADPQRLIEDLMDPAPVTFRPNLRVGEMPTYFKKEGVQHALVTTSDGILVGLD
jgi:Mg/Co/Ni transporter MgtE